MFGALVAKAEPEPRSSGALDAERILT